MRGFINAHRDADGVEPISAVLPIAPSRYDKLRARQRWPDRRPLRARRDEALGGHIRRVWRETARSTASARCGSRYGGKAVRRPAARWCD